MVAAAPPMQSAPMRLASLTTDGRIDAALDVACPPSEAQLARDAADAERLSAADSDPRN